MSGGTISWFNVKDGGAGFDVGLVEPGVQFGYDLEVDAETKLSSAEAGIDWVRPLSIDDVKGALLRYEFKPSSTCVLIEFFVRHGIINAENNGFFAEIVSRLHRSLPLPTTYPLKIVQSLTIMSSLNESCYLTHILSMFNTVSCPLYIYNLNSYSEYF